MVNHPNRKKSDVFDTVYDHTWESSTGPKTLLIRYHMDTDELSITVIAYEDSVTISIPNGAMPGIAMALNSYVPRRLALKMKITVNGIEHTVPADQPLTYESIFAFAYPGKPFRLGATIVYSWLGDGDVSRCGSIHGGEKIQPADGMSVTCVFTGNA